MWVVLRLVWNISMYVQRWSYFAVHKSILTYPFASGYILNRREQSLVNILKVHKPPQVDTHARWEKHWLCPSSEANWVGFVSCSGRRPFRRCRSSSERTLPLGSQSSCYSRHPEIVLNGRHRMMTFWLEVWWWLAPSPLLDQECIFRSKCFPLSHGSCDRSQAPNYRTKGKLGCRSFKSLHLEF